MPWHVAISAVTNLIHSFEQASGQQINRGKSALIPARQLSDDERASCLAVWNSDIRISSRERVLGVFIGIHVSIHDQYCGEVEDAVGALTPVGGVAQVFHDLLVEPRLLLAEEEEREEEQGREEGWEVESGVQGEETAHMDDMWMVVNGVRTRLEHEPM